MRSDFQSLGAANLRDFMNKITIRVIV